MNRIEEETLYEIIEYLRQKCSNEALIDSLFKCELHIDYLNWSAFNYNRELVSYTFRCDKEDVYEFLNVSSYTLARYITEYFDIDGKYELKRNEDGEFDVTIVKALNITGLPTPTKVTFEKCKEIIIDNINKAKQTIFACVAWLTNPEIMQALINKSNEGVIIFLIVDAGNENDTKNKDFLSRYGKISFPVAFALNLNKIYETEYKNLMHHKFCIIDNEVVLHGTFNWTVAAEYNDEDVTEDGNKSTVDTFMNRFIELRKKYNCYFRYNYGKSNS